MLPGDGDYPLNPDYETSDDTYDYNDTVKEVMRDLYTYNRIFIDDKSRHQMIIMSNYDKFHGHNIPFHHNYFKEI